MNQISRVTRRPSSEHPDDVADVHALFQTAIAQVTSLYELYGEWPCIERRYEELAAACDNAKIDDDSRMTVTDIVADDPAELANDRRADVAEYRAQMRREEAMWGGV